jgi:hypothetical protein
MEFGNKMNNMNGVLKSLEKLAIIPEDLAHRINAIETTAKDMYSGINDDITFKYIKDIDVNLVKNAEARDCLARAIEIHFPSVPFMLQGFFSVFKYNLQNLKI